MASVAEAPEPVVGAERDHGDLGPVPQHPVHAAEAAGRRVSAHAGVHDAVRVALAPEPRLDQGGPRLVGGHAEARRQAVAERDDDALAPPRAAGRARPARPSTSAIAAARSPRMSTV